MYKVSESKSEALGETEVQTKQWVTLSGPQHVKEAFVTKLHFASCSRAHGAKLTASCSLRGKPLPFPSAPESRALFGLGLEEYFNT